MNHKKELLRSLWVKQGFFGGSDFYKGAVLFTSLQAP